MKQKVIHKYSVVPGTTVEISGFLLRVLDAKYENGKILVWIEKETAKEDDGILRPPYSSEGCIFKFRAVRTGWVYDDSLGEYIKTVWDEENNSWHLFYKKSFSREDL